MTRSVTISNKCDEHACHAKSHTHCDREKREEIAAVEDDGLLVEWFFGDGSTVFARTTFIGVQTVYLRHLLYSYKSVEIMKVNMKKAEK